MSKSTETSRRQVSKPQSDLRQTCVDCGVRTLIAVFGWDGKWRCTEHAPNGALGMMVNHCPTCTCRKLSAQ